MANLAPSTIARLAEVTPRGAQLANPVDMLGGPAAEMYRSAGEALLAGDVVTFDPGTGKFVKADADASDAGAPLMVATKPVSAGIGVTAIKKGVVDGLDLSALAYGQAVYLSKTAGKLATAVAGVNEVQTVTITGTPTGGTFTLSNSGSFGTLFVAPIINQPQVAILSTDGITRRPVAITDERGHESIAIHSVGNLTMSWDHRAFDGGYAAAFLARMKEILQTRDWTAEL